MLKLYNFRSLGNELSLCRAKRIIETGEFWCSRFWDMNDPMEGVYLTRSGQDQGLFTNQINAKKKARVICSFSGPTAFKNPIMWDYYANGFKGIAIEIEVEAGKIKDVKYEETLQSLSGGEGDYAVDVNEILRTKLDVWKHEEEFRYITERDIGNCRIGTITAVYFGSPYSNVDNAKEIQEQAEPLKVYRRRAKELAKVIEARGIKHCEVQVNDNGSPPN